MQTIWQTNYSHSLNFFAGLNPEVYFVALLLLSLALRITFLKFQSGYYRHDFRLRRKGLEHALGGNPVEAEKCYRRALALGSKVPGNDRIRLLVCLGDALMDQGNFKDARALFAEALALGDPTGSGQGSMADLLLAQRSDPEKALQFADEAMQANTAMRRSRGERVFSSDDLVQAKWWARRARGLAQLERGGEAQQALDRSLRIVAGTDNEPSPVSAGRAALITLVFGFKFRRRILNHQALGIAVAHWHIGHALLAMHETKKAADHFRIARDRDPRGKYRLLSRKELSKLGLQS